jgi:CCR4-NOT transcriptional regulation complex NOT5 subunit
MNDKDIKTEIELLKREVEIIKTNHLSHMAKDIDNLMDDVKDIKTEVFRFKYIAYGAIVVFVLVSDKFNDILRLL